MSIGSQSLLIGAVAAVGVLHTLVPDHWLPITVMARQRSWSKSETARVALRAGAGHVLSTLAVAVAVWIASAAAARRLGNAIDTISSFALIAFGLWIGVSAWLEQHPHARAHPHSSIPTDHAQGDAGLGSTSAHEQRSRTTLMLILGSSPMVEGIPVFFAAGKYGVPLIAPALRFLSRRTPAHPSWRG